MDRATIRSGETFDAGERRIVKRSRFVLTLVLAACLVASCAPRAGLKVHHLAAPTPKPPPPAAPESSLYIPWGEHSIESRLAAIGPASRRRWTRDFDRAGLSYPPASVTLVTLKREKRVEVYAGPSPYDLSFVRSVAITAASGGPGPKLREGDRQVPEGVYAVDSLNPNSHFHVALRLAYPNAFDERMAERDHRRSLGADIMIHGGDQSVGCVAVGDQAAEDLFVISADSGLENVTVMIVPRDFRRSGESEPMPGQPAWVRSLYADLDLKLRSLPQPLPTRTTTQPTPDKLDVSLTTR